MASFNSAIELVSGDFNEIRRTITGVPAGTALSKVWFYVKLDSDDADNVAPIAKELAPSDNPGVGQIEDTGAGDTQASIRVDVAPGDINVAVLVPGNYYPWAIKALPDNSKPRTVEQGWCYIRRGLIQKTS